MFYLSFGEGRRLHRPVSVADGEKENVLRGKFVSVLRMKLLRYFSRSGKVIKDEERKRRKPEQRRGASRHLLHITIPHLGNAIFPPKTFEEKFSFQLPEKREINSTLSQYLFPITFQVVSFLLYFLNWIPDYTRNI